jgi:hypothetical protein
MTRHLPESSAGLVLLNPRAGTSTVSESQHGQNPPVDDGLHLASNPTAPTDHVGRQLTQSDAEDLKAFLKAFDEAFGGLTQKRSEEAVATNNEQHRPEQVQKEN